MALANIDMLSDFSLELVFSYLGPFELEIVAQVCQRWSDLSAARQLWSGQQFQYNERNLVECHHAVRLLSRPRGVFPFSRLEVLVERRLGFGRHCISFRDDAATLLVTTSSSLMLLLCLRHLLPARVTALKLTVSEMDALTPCEALVVWETIAAKEFLVDASFTLHRGGALFLCPFDWPQRGFLSTIKFNALGNAPAGPSVSAPIHSLLDMHRYQLSSVHIVTEDQQPLLELCPSDLLSLQAVLLPSLVRVLHRMHRLQSLTLHSHFAHSGVLARVLALSTIRHSLWDLEVVIKPGHWDEDTPDTQLILALLGRFEHLRKLRLSGLVASAAAMPTHPLRQLVKSVPQVRTLVVTAEPCMLPVETLLPDEDGAESMVPETLSCLTLEQSPLNLTYRHAVGEHWVETLRQVMEGARRLHLRVEHSACFLGDRRLSKVVITPHPVDEYCKDCPGVAAIKEKFTSIFIGDLCNVADSNLL